MTMPADLPACCPYCKQNLWRRTARDQSLLECRECGHAATLEMISDYADELDSLHALYQRITEPEDYQ